MGAPGSARFCFLRLTWDRTKLDPNKFIRSETEAMKSRHQISVHEIIVASPEAIAIHARALRETWEGRHESRLPDCLPVWLCGRITGLHRHPSRNAHRHRDGLSCPHPSSRRTS